MAIKRSTQGSSGLNPTFIGSWEIEPGLCDEVINYFEKNKHMHTVGRTASGISLESKNRTDITLTPKEITLHGNEVFRKYFEAIFECYKDYNVQWPFLKSIANRLEIGPFNIGRYNPGQHFRVLHTERCSLNTLHRLFAFMTYLNDVEEGGSTYFKHYDLDIKPKKGLTLIWPAEWTHAHQGKMLKQGSKYIITGWLNFPSE